MEKSQVHYNFEVPKNKFWHQQKDHNLTNLSNTLMECRKMLTWEPKYITIRYYYKRMRNTHKEQTGVPSVSVPWDAEQQPPIFYVSDFYWFFPPVSLKSTVHLKKQDIGSLVLLPNIKTIDHWSWQYCSVYNGKLNSQAKTIR